MDLLLLINKKSDNYKTILIVNCLIKIVYYKLIKAIINIVYLAKVIINIEIKYYKMSELIVSNQSLLFDSKFWFLLYYFFGIKRKFFMFFHL